MSGGAYGIDETPEQRRRNVIIGAGAVALVVVAALAVFGFVWWRHEDSAPGAADAVVDRLTAALNAHSAAGVRDVACSGVEDDLLQSVTGMRIDCAQKVRDTQVAGDRATGLLTLTVTQPRATPPTFEQSGYVELEKHGDWCVTSIYNAVAS